MRKQAKTQAELRRLLVSDSMERNRWMTRLLELVREEERNRVLNTMDKTRQRHEAEA